MALAYSRWAGGVTLTAITLVSFQNCSPGTFDGLSSESSTVLESSEATARFSNSQEVSGYKFSANYRSSPQDLSGMIVCEYPSGEECASDADGKSQGRMQLHETGLSASARVHKMSFEFLSKGYFAKNPEAHFAIGLRGDVTKDAKGDPISVNGRGFIIGQLGQDGRNAGNAACARDMAQIETYHGDVAMTNKSIPGNHIFSSSCSDAIFKDDLWYRLELYVSIERKIGYKVYDQNQNLLYSHLMQDPTDYLNPNLTKWFMGHVFDSPVKSSAGNWSITVKNIILSESNDAIENSFNEPLMSFYLAGNKLAENSLVTTEQMANDALSIGSFPALRWRVFGCANPETAVNAGTCNDAKDFREILMSGDGAFVKDGTHLRFMESATVIYPSDTYKLILRANPQSSYKQTVVRILKK
ncbi:MAG: hypothetical protein HUU57_10880 [Bdellovibrio sp.]|nr:hypothetical protein [Bdellovibrio sp.]